VDFTPVGGTTRRVPACALDAERVRAGADPHVRTVMQGSRRVPYWDGGPAYAPYAAGYFAAGAGMSLLFGGLLIGSMAGWGFDGWGGGYDDGYAEGYDEGYDDAGGDASGDPGDAGADADAGGDGGGFDDFGGFGDFGDGGGFGDIGGFDF
jgi:hypothetical protein